MKKYKTAKIIAILVVLGMLVSLATLYFSDYKNAKEYFHLADGDTALFLAIAKAESNFNESAISQKGAMGLCQIMPTTAQWCADQMGINYDEDMLLTPQYNANIANFYISYLQDKFDETSAICAYNAGEGNVSKWLQDEDIYQNGEYINIPFEETRTYLKKVLSYKKKFQVYIWLFGWE